jgi:hypothetical protein
MLPTEESHEPLHTDDYDPDLDPRFIGPRTLRLCMPWGLTTIGLWGKRSTHPRQLPTRELKKGRRDAWGSDMHRHETWNCA